MQRWVLHIDMDAFFASCEQLTRPTLMGRPVLVGGASGRGVVAGASYEARKYGAHSAMPMYRAQQLIGPKAVVVRPRFEVYRTASERVFSLIAQRVKLVEQLSIDEAYMEPEELHGATPAEVEAWAHELRALIREETGLPASIGAGSGKQFAKIGSGQAKPDGAFVIAADKQEALLHPLDVDELWGVGPVTATKLHSIGVKTIGDLANLSQREVEITLGATIGLSLWEMARGIDDRPVAPRAESKQVSAEHTYPEDLTTKEKVDAALERALSGAHRRLLADGRGARTVTVKLRMADFHIESRSLSLSYATDDIATLRKAMYSLARYPAELGPIRLVGVGFSGLESERQDVLFPELDQAVVNTTTTFEEEVSTTRTWYATQDVFHPDYGHGWIQGTGHGFVSVRFETRATGPGPFKSFDADDERLVPADPVDSLAWDLEELGDIDA
ncbi:DNA polymerase IV [Corynebacterium sp. L4756]|uniref:DNA polymerase IV n=1 Tax=unclassified Corynebacterium TaxID=2624378 RepID=UPI00374CDFCB